MFKKILSSIGIGVAKVDLILNQNSVEMGDKVDGRIIVRAGQVEQQIGRIDVQLRVNSTYVQNDQQRRVDESIANVKITDGFSLQPGDVKEYPFSFQVPNFIPISSLNTRYYFLTNLDIEAAVDHQDRDYIHIYPSGLMKNFFGAFENLGFTPKLEGYTGHYQMIDFRPTRWLAGQLDELVFQYSPAQTQNSISGFFEIDKKSRGMGGWIADELDLDEKKGRFHFSSSELSSISTAEQTIRNFIQRHFSNLV